MVLHNSHKSIKHITLVGNTNLNIYFLTLFNSNQERPNVQSV
jgi:hypothetical protein